MLFHAKEIFGAVLPCRIKSVKLHMRCLVDLVIELRLEEVESVRVASFMQRLTGENCVGSRCLVKPDLEQRR